MLVARRALLLALAALVALLAILDVTVRLSVPAWGVGLACGAALAAAVGRGLASHATTWLGAADLVTLTRATLACAIAALVTDTLLPVAPDPPVALVAALTTVALVLDAVDGRVARATRPTTFGARFDGEADAFLILVLSLQVAPTAGAWVVAIGATRYVFAGAGQVWPWLRDPLPPRYWRKVVAVVQAVVLLVAVTGLLPPALTHAGLVVALALLVESFSHDVAWLHRHRQPAALGSAWAARLPTP